MGYRTIMGYTGIEKVNERMNEWMDKKAHTEERGTWDTGREKCHSVRSSGIM